MSFRAGALCCALIAVAHAQDGAATIEIVAPASAVLEQPVDVALRFELDRAFFAASGVPLLQRPVDLPVQLQAAWLDPSPDHLVELVPGDGPTVAVGDRVLRTHALGAAERDGRTFDRYEVRLRWAGLVEGVHPLSGLVRFAYASAFEETLLGGRQPVDRLEHAVKATALYVALGLPGDPPPGFSGAVGEFTVTATAEVAEVELGDSFALTLQVAGPGNLMRFRAPPWPELPGFAVQGLVERDQADRREFVFDVLALAEGSVALRLPFVFFSPAANAYLQVLTEPAELTVVERSAERPLSSRVSKLIADRNDRDLGLPSWLWFALGAVLAIALGIVFRRRRRESGAPDPER